MTAHFPEPKSRLVCKLPAQVDCNALAPVLMALARGEEEEASILSLDCTDVMEFSVPTLILLNGLIGQAHVQGKSVMLTNCACSVLESIPTRLADALLPQEPIETLHNFVNKVKDVVKQAGRNFQRYPYN